MGPSHEGSTLERRKQNGFSLIELLIVVGIIGIIAAIGIPALMNAIDRAKQRRSMGDMRTLVIANATYFVDFQDYAPALIDLQINDYVEVLVSSDGWGNPLVYTVGAQTYTLTSFGSDGVAGPAPPNPWENEPFDPDIIVVDGMFTQAPDVQ